MSGIGTEIRVFCYAILTGVLIVAVYLWIRVLRRLVAHRLWLINLEDACYWAGISVYTFVQIYHTSDGVLQCTVFNQIYQLFLLFFHKFV